MKAIIKEELTRKSWSGKTILTNSIIGTKENIVDKANDYINKRIARETAIPVKKFTVEIFTHTGKKVNSWSYRPTYR